MNVMKRATVGLKRQMGQTIVLILTCFLLGSLISGAVLVNQAIVNTNNALLARLPALAIIHVDDDSFLEEWTRTGILPYRENLTISHLQELGSLPYVRHFDYGVAAFDFFSEELVRVWYPELFLFANPPNPSPIDDRSLSMWFETNFEQFTLSGVGHADVLPIEAGIIELTAGRTFTDAEMEQGMPVVIVSQSFLNVNSLVLGDRFTIEQIVFAHLDDARQQRYTAENILAQVNHEFEIVGVFDRDLPDDIVLMSFDIQDHLTILNQIFVPATFAIQTNEWEFEVLADLANVDVEELLRPNPIDFSNVYFQLYDPLSLPDFHLATTEILPDHWTISDYSFIYADITYSMTLIGNIASGVVVGATVAIVLILGLVVLLFFRMRRKEIGIYLALGEKKEKIMIQLLLELFFPIMVGLTLSLFLGSVIASEVSHRMLRESMLELQQDGLVFGDYEVLGIRIEMSHDEMIEMFELKIDAQTVITFYSVASGTVLISVMIPMIVTLKTNPKDVLTNGEL